MDVAKTIQAVRSSRDVYEVHPCGLQAHPSARCLLPDKVYWIFNNICTEGFRLEEPIISHGGSQADSRGTVLGGCHRHVAALLAWSPISEKHIEYDVKACKDDGTAAYVRFTQLSEPVTSEWGKIAQLRLYIEFMRVNGFDNAEFGIREFLGESQSVAKSARHFLHGVGNWSGTKIRRIRTGGRLIYESGWLETLEIMEARGEIVWDVTHFACASDLSTNAKVQDVLQASFQSGTLCGGTNVFYEEHKKLTGNKKRKVREAPAGERKELVDIGKRFKRFLDGDERFKLKDIRFLITLTENCAELLEEDQCTEQFETSLLERLAGIRTKVTREMRKS